MGGTHFLQTGYLLLNRNAPYSLLLYMNSLRIRCQLYLYNIIFTFGNADNLGIMYSAKWNRKEKEKVDNLYIIAKKIIDVRPTILKAINCKNYRKSPGLFKIAERLNVKIKGEQHNALNDAVLLYGVCRELNIQMSI